MQTFYFYYRYLQKTIYYIAFTLCAVIFVLINSGCDSQKNFKPQVIKGKIFFNDKLEKKIAFTNREGAKLKNNKILTPINPLNTLQLESQENLLSQDSKSFILANGCNAIHIVPLVKNGEKIELDRANMQAFEMQGCVVAASMKDNLIAGIFGDNTIFLYDITKKDFIMREKGESIYAISSLIANPVFLDTLVVFPTLDGRLNTIDRQSLQSVKNIIVNTDKFLNNIIYLKVNQDELVAATQKRIYTLIRGESYNKELEIRDLYFDGTYLYVLSLNGIIYQFDKTLAPLHSIKLPYANLNGILIKNNHLYTFENSGGYLIDLDMSTFTYDTFKLNFGMSRWFSKKSTIFYTDQILYINKRILDFGRDFTIKLKKVKSKKSK